MNDIIACIDGSRASRFVCDYAAWASLRLDAPLTLLHVIHNPHAERPADLSGNIGIDSREQLLDEMVELEERRGRLLREQGKVLLADAEQRVQNEGIAHPQRLLRHGTITDTLGELQAQAQLVVLGKQGRDGDRVARHVGSHLESIIRTLQRPILVAPLSYRQPERFLIAYDGSATADQVVERVGQSPLLRGLPAHLLMVAAEEPANRGLLEQAAARLASYGFAVHARLQPGTVAEVMGAYSKEHDIHLVAMGAYGHSRLRQLFVGSTTTRMIMESPLPLLILR